MNGIFKINDCGDKYLNISENISSILSVEIKNLSRNIKKFISQYKNICFVENYNEKIIWLHEIVEIIRFEVDYEYPLDNLPSQLIKLVFLFGCNQTVDNLPSNIKIIYFGMNFNQSLDMLPESLEEIYLLSCFNCPIDNLPRGLKILTLSNAFAQSISNLPKGLIELSLGDSFTGNLTNLPQSLERIKIGNGFTNKITQLPPKLNQIIIPSKYKYMDEFKLIWKNFVKTKESYGMITFEKIKKMEKINQVKSESFVDIINLGFKNFIEYIQYDIFE